MIGVANHKMLNKAKHLKCEVLSSGNTASKFSKEKKSAHHWDANRKGVLNISDNTAAHIARVT